MNFLDRCRTMRIHSLSFSDETMGWSIDKIDFLDLTLLVGISGVGKTQILKAVFALRHIANGISFPGLTWKIEFSIQGDDNIYTWEGKTRNTFSKIDEIFGYYDAVSNFEEIEYTFKKESLSYRNEEVIFERNTDESKYQGVKIPKISPSQSLLWLLRENDRVMNIRDDFLYITFRNSIPPVNYNSIAFMKSFISKYLREIETFNMLKNSSYGVLTKIVLCALKFPQQFNTIKNNYMEVFPQIEEIKIEQIMEKVPWYVAGGDSNSDRFAILFKEKNVDKWIPLHRLSYGMFISFIHIAELYLVRNDSVILIDEFENSLGVNCIDILTEDILTEPNRLQYIITSHHPYIINNIPYEFWKVVYREGSVVKTINATELNLGESKHDRFMALINHPFYMQQTME